MGMSTYFGTPWNAFQESWEFCRQVELTSPILNNYELEKFAQTKNLYVRGVIIPILFEINSGPHCLKIALQNICKKAEEKIHLGYNTLILSDRNISENFAAIPIVLATACVHFHLIKKGKRGGIGIILETGQARLVHHMAVLIGYGANGINPYLAFESIRNLRSRDILPPKDGNEDDYEDPCAFYERNYQKALKKGLFKIMSKMGISTLASYQGAHIFEIIGLSENVANQYFNGTDSPLGGIEIEEIKEDVLCFHKLAFSTTVAGNLKIEYGGELKWTPHGENHINDPTSIALLQQAVRENSYEKFKKYSTQINQHNQTPFLVRRFLKLTNKQKPISIDQVEPVSEIVKRFVTGAMSLGALSPEAHENLAIAMNKIQGKSNSGEGGEDPRRYKKNKNGEIRRSAIKQIASGRFGVTTEYLLNANELQIKIAQGAKPGEGGQLPGHKVNPYIAKLRHSIPGVSLISPPPHHDIYSIEDLAQLIFDLKNVNPEAKVSVKLVSEWGVGTIAAGVAKAHAETIIIAGHDGGTGASPISSVKQSGIPWELGLAQTQQTLCLNNLRQRVKLQVDGQLKTGLDIIVAAILGADEYGFATMPLIAQGCVMMRKCHLDTCPVGIATQNDELRKKFTGKPEHIVHLMQFLAEEVREYLSYLGFENIQEIIGRTDLLNFNNQLPQGRYSTLNWQRILHKVDTQGSDAFVTSKQEKTTSVCIDDHIIEEISKSDVHDKFTINLHISTQNRAVGSKLSGWLYKNREIYSQKIIEANFKGSSGQSFGAFLYHGLRLNLEGESNDYLGKGMSGGMITLFPPREASYFSKENWIAGNALLYGATGGEVYIAGRAGERFAVRNSGCTAVIEGVGDHACEYMTGGKVVVLGHTGRNFAAGMSGGIAYILDEERLFSRRCNPGMVDIEQTREEDYPDLLKLIQNHYNYTESLTAKDVMDRWEEIKGLFIKIIPREYKKYIISTYQVDTRRMNHGLR